MCYNCGCHIPQDDMGNPNNITDQMLATLSQSANMPIDEFKQQLLNYLNNPAGTQNLSFEEMFTKAARAWGQSIEKAKNNTKELLASELKK